MNWSRSVWLYCERGTETALLAEPFNAATNIAFFAAGLAAWWTYLKLPPRQRSADHLLLIGLVLLIGLGSLLFHLFANQWSELADMAPIFLFMLVYLGFMLSRFLHMPPGWMVFSVVVFTLLTALTMTMTCQSLGRALQPAWTDGQATSCLNGSLGYAPALIALLLVAISLQRKGHRVAATLYWGAAIFALSLIARSVDHLFCAPFSLFAEPVGTHFLWHLLNALLLYLLLRGALLNYSEAPAPQIILPIPRRRGS